MKGIVVAAVVAAGASFLPLPVDRPVTVTEDNPAWNCAVDGNRICGPGNASGLPAGCYSDIGQLVAAWPCYVVENADGSSEVFTPDARGGK